MTCTLIPLALNELLDRPLIVSFNSASVFLSFAIQDSILSFPEACLTPELTGRGMKHSILSQQRMMKAIQSALRLNELLDLRAAIQLSIAGFSFSPFAATPSAHQ